MCLIRLLLILLLLLIAKLLEKRFALAAQFLFELVRAIAIAASPSLAAVFVPAISTRVRVFHTEKLEIFFPIWPLLGERRIAKTSLDPCRDAIAEPGFAHIIDILTTGDRTFAERAAVDRVQERFFFARFQFRFDQVTHDSKITLIAADNSGV